MYETDIEALKKQIQIMKDYLIMNLDRDDYHSCWDASIDLVRLHDRLEWIQKHPIITVTDFS